MPGYENWRFVNLTQNQSQQLTCGICLAILRNPKYTKCCEQAYCLDCIEEWLLNSETCPNDRKQLKRNELCNVPKFVNNMLQEMVLSCQFTELGCSEFHKLELIEHQEDNCKSNPQAISQDCLSENGERSEHQGDETLKRKYLKGEERNNELTKELDILIGNYSYKNEKLIDNLRISMKELTEVKQYNESKQMQETILKPEGITQINQNRIKYLEEKLESAKEEFLLFHNNAILNYTTIQESFDVQIEINKKSFEKIINDNKQMLQNLAKNTKKETLATSCSDDGQNILENKISNKNNIYETITPANQNLPNFNINRENTKPRTYTPIQPENSRNPIFNNLYPWLLEQESKIKAHKSEAGKGKPKAGIRKKAQTSGIGPRLN